MLFISSMVHTDCVRCSPILTDNALTAMECLRVPTKDLTLNSSAHSQIMKKNFIGKEMSTFVLQHC